MLAPLFPGESFERALPWDEPWPITPLLASRALWHGVRLRSLEAGYLAAMIEAVKPKIVITYIDNSLHYQKVVSVFPQMRFLAIQNGGRLVERDHMSRPVRHRDFACFGQVDVEQYKAYGARVDRYLPIGSLKDAYYRAQYGGAIQEKKFDLCFVSQVKPQHDKVYPKTMESLSLLASHMSRFAREHGKSVCVAARRGPGNPNWDWECSWYRERMGADVAILPNSGAEYSSYRTIDQSRVSLAMHTTLLREGFGRGARVLSCNYTGDPRYDFPEPGPWSLTDPSYQAFEERLDTILSWSSEEWERVSSKSQKRVMAYEESRPTDAVLREAIRSALSGERRPA